MSHSLKSSRSCQYQLMALAFLKVKSQKEVRPQKLEEKFQESSRNDHRQKGH